MKLFPVAILTIILLSVNLPAKGDPSAEEHSEYELKFLMIPAVHIEMDIFVFPDTPIKKVTFYTETYALISRLLEVRNKYSTWYDDNSFSVVKYEKDIRQSNVKHILKGEYSEGIARFSNGKSVILSENSVHNVFTTLIHLREIPVDSLSAMHWITEVEGKQYHTEFKFRGYEDLTPGNVPVTCRKIEIFWKEVYENQKGVIGPTDVFSYEVVNPEGKRLIWIEDQPPHRIVKAAFSLSPFWLTATLEE